MSTNILGGICKGMPLFVLDHPNLRPTSVRLKRRLFDRMQNFSGYLFVDLCAGTGSVGIEAWSRGAEALLLVENGKNVYRHLKDNVSLISLKHEEDIKQRNITIKFQDVLSFISSFLKDTEQLPSFQKTDTILFFDPPYENHVLYKSVFDLLNKSDFVGELWVESDRQKGVKLEDLMQMSKNMKHYKTLEQGTSFIAMFKC